MVIQEDRQASFSSTWLEGLNPHFFCTIKKISSWDNYFYEKFPQYQRKGYEKVSKESCWVWTAELTPSFHFSFSIRWI